MTQFWVSSQSFWNRLAHDNAQKSWSFQDVVQLCKVLQLLPHFLLLLPMNEKCRCEPMLKHLLEIPSWYPYILDQLQSRLMLEEIRRQTRSRLKSATIEALYFHSNRSYTHHNQHMKGSNPSSPNFSTAHYTTQGHENNMPQNQHTLCHYYGKLEHFKHMCPERLVDIRKLKS